MYQRKDGYFVKQIINPKTGRRITFYGKTEKEVMHKILNYKNEEKRGRTFDVVAAEYWQKQMPTLAEQSKRTYYQAFLRAIEAFGNRRIQTITSKDIRQLLNHVAAQGYASRTVSNQRMVLNQIFKHACIEGDTDNNPVQYITVPKGLPKTKRKAASSTDEEIVKRSAKIWLLPYIAIMTGMRRGEILALKWNDIDFENNVIHITKSIAYKGNRAFVKEPKTVNAIRSVPLLTPLREELLTRKIIPENYVVSVTGKKPLTNGQYNKYYDRYKRLTGITSSVHQLRHSFATIAFEQGIPPKTIQELLGHAQLSTTMDIYTDFRQKAFENAAEKLNEAMKK